MSGTKSVPSEKSNSCRSGVSSGSSRRSSVKERMRQMEEAKLKMQELGDKQRIEREIEQEEHQLGIRRLQLEREVAKRKADKLRKLELLEAEGEFKLAETNLLIEREDADNKSTLGTEYNAFRTSIIHSSKNVETELGQKSGPIVRNSGHASLHISSSTVKDSGLSVIDTITTARYAGLLESQNPKPPVQNVTWSRSFTNLSNPSIIPNSKPPVQNVPRSANYTSLPTFRNSKPPGRYASAPNLQDTDFLGNQNNLYQVPFSGSRPVSSGGTFDHTHHRTQDAPQVTYTDHSGNHQPYVPSSCPVTTQPLQLQKQFSDPLVTIAEALRQGPSLPKVELMKFSGDPAEYAEFVTNFRDNIENQVGDISQRLTRLLAQCEEKAKEVIKSCVSLPLH